MIISKLITITIIKHYNNHNAICLYFHIYIVSDLQMYKVQHIKSMFSKTNFVLLTLTLEIIESLSNLNVRILSVYFSICTYVIFHVGYFNI